MMSKFPSNLLPEFGLISWKIPEKDVKIRIANILTKFWVHISDVPTSTDRYVFSLFILSNQTVTTNVIGFTHLCIVRKMKSKTSFV